MRNYDPQMSIITASEGHYDCPRHYMNLPKNLARFKEMCTIWTQDTPGTIVNYWPMSLAPTNEESVWCAGGKPLFRRKPHLRLRDTCMWIV